MKTFPRCPFRNGSAPDFSIQRCESQTFSEKTAHWSPEQVADLISTFARRDLIPAVILWRAGQNVFVIDGAHRLSALIAWVHDDYGDKEVSRKIFQDLPDEQIAAAERTRLLVAQSVGSYRDHKIALEYPGAELALKLQNVRVALVGRTYQRNGYRRMIMIAPRALSLG